MSAATERPVVIFDGVCNLCDRAVQFILDHDRRGVLMLTANQSEPGQRLLAGRGSAATPIGEDASADDTIVLVEGGRLYERSAAALRIARHMGLPWSLLYAFIVVPRPIRDAVYKFIARNRYRWFGKRESCRLPRPGELERFLA